jgi:hypothetical protein
MIGVRPGNLAERFDGGDDRVRVDTRHGPLGAYLAS